MEKSVDPWALLREARKVLGHPFITVEHHMMCDRIDAALAAHRDEVPAQDSAKGVVKWCGDSETQFVSIGHVYIEINNEGEEWYWKVCTDGFAPTLDEAKSAAIAAARGLR